MAFCGIAKRSMIQLGTKMAHRLGRANDANVCFGVFPLEAKALRFVQD